jgi:DNA polymerase-3 subunit gamma/tau
MSYLVLARKYRPRSFADVAGQELVTRVLQGAIADARIGHAYLFCGPRGTGKTTLARIFAKALNCEQGPAREPCGRCERCTSADAGGEADIVEIDAASHTGVDDVRELRDQASYAPLRARYKVYIIDEAHMLSKQAFNALLKTLEEPPAHVVFLFATTEPHKVIGTVLSRCQVLRLAPIGEEQIARRLAQVCALEEFQFGAGVVEELARRSAGGLRDALSLTDQLVALVGPAPTAADLARLAPEGGARDFEDLLDELEARDRTRVLVRLTAQQGREAELVSGLLGALRAGLIALHLGPEAPVLSGPADLRARQLERARRLGADGVQIYFGELIAARERMRELPGHEAHVLLHALLELCQPGALLPLAALEARLLELEQRLGGLAAAQPAVASAAPSASAPRASERASDAHLAPPASAPSGSAAVAPRAAERTSGRAPNPAALGETWKALLEELAKASPGLADLLRRRGRLVDAAGPIVRAALEALTETERRMAADKRNLAAAARAFERVLGRPVEVALDAGAPATGAPSAADPFTQKVAQLFGGALEERS